LGVPQACGKIKDANLNKFGTIQDWNVSRR